MTTLAVTSVNSLLCQASTCFRIGSKFRCIRSTPTEMQSMSENDFECFASTGVNTPMTISPIRVVGLSGTSIKQLRRQAAGRDATSCDPLSQRILLLLRRSGERGKYLE